MCEFCAKHGEGRKWYLAMKNYAEDLLHAELPASEQQVVDARTRAEWLERFLDNFERPAMAGQALPPQQVFRALVLPLERKRPPATEEEIVRGRQLAHFGQVVPIEDVERIIDLVDSITRLPCGCRFLTTGKADKRYCFGLGTAPNGMLRNCPEAAASLEVLDKAEAKRILRAYDQEGLIHSVWTGVTPLIFGLCNCDRDCLAYRTYIEERGAPTFFRGEYVGRVDADLCTGCKACMTQCQFGAEFYSAGLAKVYIDPTRCFGCGVCRAACPTGAIELLPRDEVAPAAGVWLRYAKAHQQC